MHLADGIVTDPAVLVGLNLVGAGSVAAAVRRADASDHRAIAWTGMLAAFVLAAQGVNVPLLPGTSAHVIGAALVTLAVGAAPAIIAMTAVLIVQAFLLGDGGITVLGINVVNLAILPVLSVELASRVFGRGGGGLVATAILGTLVGNLLGAASLGATLVAGAGAAPRVTFGWLLTVQGFAGLAEGVLTAIAARELERRAPHLLAVRVASVRSGSDLRGTAAWAAIAIGVATALVPFASNAPDALERLLPELARNP